MTRNRSRESLPILGAARSERQLHRWVRYSSRWCLLPQPPALSATKTPPAPHLLVRYHQQPFPGLPGLELCCCTPPQPAPDCRARSTPAFSHSNPLYFARRSVGHHRLQSPSCRRHARCGRACEASGASLSAARHGSGIFRPLPYPGLLLPCVQKPASAVLSSHRGRVLGRA